MDWTFPMQSLPGSGPETGALRSMLAWSLKVLAENIRAGAEVLAVAPLQDGPVVGWPHWHAQPELFIQAAGVSRFAIPGADLTVTAGSALLFPPLTAHREAVAGRPFANLVVSLREQQLYYHLTIESAERPGHLHILRPDVVACDDFGGACLRSLARTQAEARLRAALFAAFCAWGAATLATAAAPGGGGSARVQRARELIAARLDSPHCTVTQVAEWVGCHPDHLARMFRRETGETLVGHLRRRRLEQARELLRDPHLRVSEAARLAGFTDPAYFCRVWRQQYGTTPGAARAT